MTMKKPIMKNGVKHWKCAGCKQIKAADLFYNNKYGHYHCKDCTRESSKARESRLRKKLREEAPPQSDQELLRSLQAWDSSWTMEKLTKAKSDPT